MKKLDIIYLHTKYVYMNKHHYQCLWYATATQYDLMYKSTNTSSFSKPNFYQILSLFYHCHHKNLVEAQMVIHV